MQLSHPANLYFVTNRDGIKVQLGYQPQWTPRTWAPGLGNAPQMVFNTFAALPFSVEGPGNTPLSTRQIQSYPTMVGMQFLQSGLPTTAGGIQAGPLTYMPLVANPEQQMYPGYGY